MDEDGAEKSEVIQEDYVEPQLGGSSAQTRARKMLKMMESVRALGVGEALHSVRFARLRVHPRGVLCDFGCQCAQSSARAARELSYKP